MKRIKILYSILLVLLVTSCNNYLDEAPDNRAEVDSKEKIQKLLVSSYAVGNYALACELSTDNIEDVGENNPYSERVYEQMATWNDVTEDDNDDLKTVWENCYNSIAHSNEALAAIEKLGDDDLLAEKGEALMTRAYAHFVLVNVFCQHYNAQTSGSDLGIPYVLDPETKLNPQYSRGTVKEVYEKINADIEAALPLMRDDIYSVPMYHFTTRAAYAFAARFNLYYENWDKAIEYASLVSGFLRNWVAMGELPRDPSVVNNAYIADDSNLLAVTAGSSIGVYFGAYYAGSRYNHTAKVAAQQTLWFPMPWLPATLSGSIYKYRAFVYSGTNLDKTLFCKIPYLFEYTDPVAGIGYRRTVTVPFTVDETLLVRAEAYIHKKQYALALNDINLWGNNFFNEGDIQLGDEVIHIDGTTTLEQINEFYDAIPYSSEEAPNDKKELHAKFSIEKGTQENMIQYLLHCRRILTLHEGLRWFDIKRYGIEVPRFQIQNNGSVKVLDVLQADDLRKAIQIPADVVSAGLEANPR